MTKAKKTRKHSWFDHQGLPIAALSLVFLLIFLLITINLTKVEEDEGNVQGLFNFKNTAPVKKAVKTNATVTTQTQNVDSVIRQIDMLLKSNNGFSDNLADIK